MAPVMLLTPPTKVMMISLADSSQLKRFGSMNMITKA